MDRGTLSPWLHDLVAALEQLPDIVQRRIVEIGIVAVKQLGSVMAPSPINPRILGEGTGMQYQTEQPTLNDEIALLVLQYPRLGPLFEQAMRDLPEHAVRALVYNVQIWIRQGKQGKEDFQELHRKLGEFLSAV